MRRIVNKLFFFAFVCVLVQAAVMGVLSVSAQNTLEADVKVTVGQTVTLNDVYIGENRLIVIDDGATLVIDGSVENDGVIINNGTCLINGNFINTDSFINNYRVENNGNTVNNGDFENCGVVVNNGSMETKTKLSGGTFEGNKVLNNFNEKNKNLICALTAVQAFSIGILATCAIGYILKRKQKKGGNENEC